MGLKEIALLLKNDLKGKTARQTSILYFSMVLSMALGILSGIINTRALGPAGYGVLSLFLSINTFLVIFFDFGVSTASGQLAARARTREKERDILGAAVVIALAIGVAYAVFIFASSFFVDGIFHSDIGWILRWMSPLLAIMPMVAVIQLVSPGMNRLEVLSLYNIVPAAVYLVGALMLLQLITVDVFTFALLNVISAILGVTAVLAVLKPTFNDLRGNTGEIVRMVRDYGSHVYVGNAADQSTIQMDRLLIVVFANSTQMGFYSLSMMIVSPISSMSNALSNSMFKGFVHADHIPRKVQLYNLAWLLCCLAGVLLLGHFIVVTLFTDKFELTAQLMLPLAIAASFKGLYQPYNIFIAAHEKGKWLRNMSFLMCFVNLFSYTILIAIWGAWGAAVGTILGNVVYYLTSLWCYNKLLKELQV